MSKDLQDQSHIQEQDSTSRYTFRQYLERFPRSPQKSKRTNDTPQSVGQKIAKQILAELLAPK